MPDIFVAPDEKNDPPAGGSQDLHKRVPLDTGPSIQEAPLLTTSDTNNNASTTPTVFSGTTDIDAKPESTKNSIPLFTAFWQNPTGIYFDSQELNEHILLFLRRHPITNTGWVVATILLCFLPPVTLYVTMLLGKTIMIGSIAFTAALIIFYYLLIFTNAFLKFLSWYYNVTLITENRVIDIELNNLVGKKISATKISLVQDVNYQQAGTLRSIFDYGDVLIQTASAVDNFYIHAVPNPEIVERVMDNIIGESGNHVSP